MINFAFVFVELQQTYFYKTDSITLI